MALNVPGVIAIVFFYLLVLGTGIWASFKSKKAKKDRSADQMEMTLLGNRRISQLVGIFTMTATWIGGSFINGLAEAAYTPSMGLVQVAVLLAGNVAFYIICGLFFAKPMRDRRYVTMLDLFQIKYGKVLTGVMAVLSLLTDLVCIPTTLIGLGSSMSVILDLSYTLSIWISAAVAVTYTLLGGLYSVAYTDVIQLILIFVSLWLCVPFVVMNPASSDITNMTLSNTSHTSWLGTRDTSTAWKTTDTFLALALGALCYQATHQRTLSASSSKTAQINCFASAVTVIIFAIPPTIIGVVAASTDWNQTSYGSLSPFESGQAAMILPLTLNYLTPSYISIIGIGAVAAAVMSSADSILLSAASIFTSSVYKNILRNQASQRELQWVIRAAVVVVGVVGTSLTMFQNSIVALLFFGVAVAYVFIFPQLVCVIFFDQSSGYGAIMGFVVSLLLKALCGEPMLGVLATIHLPGDRLEDGVHIQNFPVNTMCMLSSIASIFLFSFLAALLFNKGLVPERWDVFKVKVQDSPPATGGAMEDNGKVDEKDPQQEVSEPMMDSHCPSSTR